MATDQSATPLGQIEQSTAEEVSLKIFEAYSKSNFKDSQK
jgi:hypothetical protein